MKIKLKKIDALMELKRVLLGAMLEL